MNSLYRLLLILGLLVFLFIGANVIYLVTRKNNGLNNNNSGSTIGLIDKIIGRNKQTNPSESNINENSKESKTPTYKGLANNQIIIDKQDLLNLQQQVQTCKQINHFTIVLINTGGEVHKQIRTLVGSIHRFHEYELLIYVYGLDLNEATKNEIYLWKNVEFWDIKELYSASNNIDREEKIGIKYWKALVFKHSSERLGKFVYIQPGYYLTNKLNINGIEEYLERYGSFYMSPLCNDNIDISMERHLEITTSVDVAFHGMKYNSFAYSNVYIPLFECSRFKCPTSRMKATHIENYSKLSDDQSKAIKCQDSTKLAPMLSTNAPSESACYIIMRDDFILSPAQLPGYPQKSWVAFDVKEDKTGIIKQPNDDRIHIAFGVPTTSKGHKHLHENPIFKVFIPALKNTIPKKDSEEGKKYLYKLYLAIDRSDPLYDNQDIQKQFKERVLSEMSEYPFVFQIIRVINSHGWVPMLWNAVFQHSIDDGADYFYQLNDDVSFKTKDWTRILINRLVNNPLRSNLGVTGPTDEGNRSIFTQAFVHRTHNEIFGYFYPYVFKNWYSDDWISLVYRDHNSYFKDTTVMVHNSQTFGTRYDVCDANGKENLHKVLHTSKLRINEWLSIPK
ncbi:hypothetical protein ABK040_007102 [Willaertia magna]